MRNVNPFHYKLLAAVGLLFAVLLLPSFGLKAPASHWAWSLGAVVLMAVGLWLAKARAPKALPSPRLLSVAARTGLSAKCGLALVQAEGRNYLVAYGDGFAQIHETISPRPDGSIQMEAKP